MVGRGFTALLFILIFGADAIAQSRATAHNLSAGSFSFNQWNDNERAGIFPASMVLQQYAADATPKQEDEPVGDWPCMYNIQSWSRIIGLGRDGIGFINTTNTQNSDSLCGGAAGATGGRVGVAVLALDTRGREEVTVRWKALLIQQGAGFPEPREYRLKAQYRTDSSAAWVDLPNSTRFSSRGRADGDFARYEVVLPTSCNNRPYLQIRWKYYQQDGNDGGSRPLIALDDIRVFSAAAGALPNPVIFADMNRIGEMGALIGQRSDAEFIEVEAYHLRANLNVSVPQNFGISLSPAGPFQSQLSVSPLNGTIPLTRLYVTYLSNTPGSVQGAILLQSAGANTTQVGVTGEAYPMLYINEIMPSNFKSVRDSETGEFEDWVEIYNPNNFAVNLSNYYLTDSRSTLTKHRLSPNVYHIIPPGGFVTYWASGIAGRRNHIPFSLSSSGEFLALIGKNGKTVLDSLGFTEIPTDLSFGRETNGGKPFVYFNKHTFSESNHSSQGYAGIAGKPIFNHPGGMYGIELLLRISAEHPDAVVIYTTDGSDPDIENLGGTIYSYKNEYPSGLEDLPKDFEFGSYKSFKYSSPIELTNLTNRESQISEIKTSVPDWLRPPRTDFSKGTTIKARVYEPGKLPGEIVTNTYFINNNFNQEHKLPIASFSTAPHLLFDYHKGIYVPGVDFDNWRVNNPQISFNPSRDANYRRRGRDAEIPGTIEIINPSGRSVFNSNLGLRIHGNWSRARDIKSFRLYSRNAYASEEFNFKFFNNLHYQNFKRLLFRNSGEDAILTYFKDAMTHISVAHLDVDIQSYQPYVAYLNGEFWGILNARERVDQHYLQQKYRLESADLDFLQNRNTVILGSTDHYQSMMDFIAASDMRSKDNFAELQSKWMDTESYIDQIVTKIYYACLDWPGNNVRYWRYNKQVDNGKKPFGMDGRWRWIIYDNDSGLDVNNIPHNTLDYALSPPDSVIPPPWSTELFRSLIVNEAFKKELYTRFADLANTAFEKNRQSSLIDSIKNLIAHDMSYHVERYQLPSNLVQWNVNVNRLDSFVQHRQPHIYRNFIDYFDFTGSASITMNVNDFNMGYIKINTVEINEFTPGTKEGVYPWVGVYFTPMEIRLIALPREGHAFSHWETENGRLETDTIFINFSKASTVTAHFIPDDNYQYFPPPYALSGCSYQLNKWEPTAAGVSSNPQNVAFISTKYADSGLEGELYDWLDSIAFNHSTRTRVNGLGERGLSFINTTNANDNYYPTRIGGMVAAFSTQNVSEATLAWTAQTLRYNSKEYAVRIQYRLGDRGPFKDLRDANNRLIEFKGGTEQRFEGIQLPAEILNKPYVQLLFRYYHTGLQRNPNSDARDEIRIDDIVIRQKEIIEFRPTGPHTSSIIANNNGATYQWFSCLSANDTLLALPGEMNRSLQIRQPGYYAVGINYDNCWEFSPCEWYDVKELRRLASGVEYLIYPNPSPDILNVSFRGEVKNIFLSIIDINGQQMDGRFLNATQMSTFDIRTYPAGVYILTITDKDGVKENVKFVKL